MQLNARATTAVKTAQKAYDPPDLTVAHGSLPNPILGFSYPQTLLLPSNVSSIREDVLDRQDDQKLPTMHLPRLVSSIR
jgi:hypothetical protein